MFLYLLFANRFILTREAKRLPYDQNPYFVNGQIFNLPDKQKFICYFFFLNIFLNVFFQPLTRIERMVLGTKLFLYFGMSEYT